MDYLVTSCPIDQYLILNPSVPFYTSDAPQSNVVMCTMFRQAVLSISDAPANTSLRSEIDYQDDFSSSKFYLTDNHY